MVLSHNNRKIYHDTIKLYQCYTNVIPSKFTMAWWILYQCFRIKVSSVIHSLGWANSTNQTSMGHRDCPAPFNFPVCPKMWYNPPCLVVLQQGWLSPWICRGMFIEILKCSWLIHVDPRILTYFPGKIWQSEIPLSHSHLEVTLLVQEEVFRLQVAIDDMSFVQVVEGTQHSGAVEFCVLLTAIETWTKIQRKRMRFLHIFTRSKGRKKGIHDLVGGLNPSEKYQSIGMIIPNIWENKNDVPNHQPVIHGNIHRVFLPEIWYNQQYEWIPTGKSHPTETYEFYDSSSREVQGNSGGIPGSFSRMSWDLMGEFNGTLVESSWENHSWENHHGWEHHENITRMKFLNGLEMDINLC